MNGQEAIKEACRVILHEWSDWERAAQEAAMGAPTDDIDEGEIIEDASILANLEVVVGGLVDGFTNEVASVLMVMDSMAKQWGDEGRFRTCRDRLRSLLSAWQRKEVARNTCSPLRHPQHERDPMTLREYQAFCRTTAVYPWANCWSYLPLGLCGEAGEVAQWRKRILRDADGVITPADLEKLRHELGDVLWYVAELCNAAGFTMQDVIDANVAKLSDRKDRGVIHGDGGSR